MKIVAISDIHGKLENLEKISDEIKAADAVFFAGDFSEDKKDETAKPVLDALCKMNDSVFAVIGNCDNPDLLDEIEKEDVSVHAGIVFYEGLAIAGSSGGSVFTKTTAFERTEEELQSDFDVIKNSNNPDEEGQWNNLVLISHNPPKDTVCDKINAGIHVGSQTFRDFIIQTKPLLVVTGHIHEGVGSDKIGDTVVLNPGAVMLGQYATLEIEKKDGSWAVRNVELKSI